MPADIIVAATFRGLEVHDHLVRLALDDSLKTRLFFCDDRVRLIRSVIAAKPSVVLFPVQDARGDMSGPLIARLRHEAPDIHPAVLVRLGDSSHGVLDAVRDGASVYYWNSATDLLDVIRCLGGPDAPPPTDPGVLGALLVGVHPEHCVRVLIHCVEHAHRHLHVDDVALQLGVSRRSLSRWMRLAFWPTPAEVIEWARLLRASVIQWRDENNGTALARAAGFADPTALRRAVSTLLKSQLPASQFITPLLVTTMLRRRLDALARKGGGGLAQ